MMKKLVLLFSLLFSFGLFAQTFTIEEVSDIKIIDIDNQVLSVVKEYKKKDKEYEYGFYRYDDEFKKIAYYRTSKDKHILRAHVHMGSLILVMYYKERNKNPATEDKKRYNSFYSIISADLETGEVKSKMLNIREPDNILGDNHRVFFVYVNQKFVRFVDYTVFDLEKKYDYVLSDSIIELIEEKYFKELVSIDNSAYNEHLGSNRNRVYLGEDNIYMTFESFDNHNVNVLDFSLEGENEFKNYLIRFPFEKSVKDYNSSILEDKFYQISERKGEVFLQIFNLLTEDLQEYDLLSLEKEKIWEVGSVKKLVQKFNYVKHIPSITVNELADGRFFVELKGILKDSGYYGNQMMFDMMWQQMNFHMQNMMNINIPGGFRIQELPIIAFDSFSENTFSFVVDDRGILKYDGEETKYYQQTSSFDLRDEVSEYLDLDLSKNVKTFGGLKYVTSYWELNTKMLLFGVYIDKTSELKFGTLKNRVKKEIINPAKKMIGRPSK